MEVNSTDEVALNVFHSLQQLHRYTLHLQILKSAKMWKSLVCGPVTLIMCLSKNMAITYIYICIYILTITSKHNTCWMSVSLYNKLIKMIFLQPADHQSVSEKGSCTVDSMESSLKGSDGCSLKNNPRKDDHFFRRRRWGAGCSHELSPES